MTDTLDLPQDVFKTGIYKCVVKAGGVAELAQKAGVSRQAAYHWLRRKYVSVERAMQLEDLFGIPRQDLVKPSLRGAFDTGGVYKPYV